MLTTKKALCRCRSMVVALAVGAILAACTPDGPRALMKGERLIRDGQPAEALPLLEQAVKLLPGHAQAWNHLGLARHGAGQLDAAADAYQQAINLDRNLAVARFNYGCLLLDRDRPAEAARELATFTGLQVKSEPGWFQLGLAQLRSGQLNEAEKSFQRVLQLTPGSAPAMNGLGLVLVQRNRPQQAFQQFEAAFAANNHFAPALLNQAVTAQVHLRDRALAARKYREYLALSVLQEHRTEAQDLLQSLETELRPAVPASNTAAASRPFPPARTESEPAPAATRRDARPPARAPAEATVAATRKVEVPAAPAAQVIPEKRPVAAPVVAAAAKPEARTVGTAAVQAPPQPEPKAVAPPAPRYGGPRYGYRSPAAPKAGDRAEAARLLGTGVEAQQGGRTTEALEAYRQAVQADPALFEARFNLGLLAYQEKLPDALPSLETALVINPASTRARHVFGLALEQAGYPRDAANELEKVSQDSPSDARVHFALGHLYAEKLRDPARAREHYLKLLELQPQHPQATAIRFWVEQHP